MPDAPTSSFGVTFHFWIPIVAVALLAVAFVAYARTTPALSGRVRPFLMSLRAVVFLLQPFAGCRKN